MKKETTPEQYLREIRDAQLLNTQLLERLLAYEQKDVSRRNWGTVFKIAGMLLPYAFTLGVTWVFYDKVQDSFEVIKSLFSFIPSFSLDSVPEMNTDSFSPASIDDAIKNVTDGASSLWENKNDYLDSGVQQGKDIVETIEF